MADYTIVEEALKRGYTMDEIADNLARDNGVDPADARGRGYTTGEMMKNLGYVKPETSDVARGFVTSFKQLPQLGYGLLAGAGAVAESVAGEGGVSTSMKNFGVKKYQEAGADIEKDSKQSDSLSYSWEQAKQGDFGSLVDWLQYGIGYGGGQAVQALATAGVGSLVGKTVLKGTAENLASKMVAKEALRLGATEEAKRLTAQEISKIAVANVASNIGQTVAIGSQAFGMEGGEIFGDLAQKTVKEGRAATGGELAKAFGATAAAGALEFVGDKLGVDVMLGKSKMFKPASSMTGVGGRAARAAVAVPGTVLAEGGTEYLQTGIEEYGKGNEKNFLPFMQSESAQKQALDAAGLGAVGGGGMAMVGGAFSSPQKKDAAPSPSPSISSAQTADDAIAAFQSEVDSVTPAPRGSFGSMDDLAGLIESERSDLGKRRGLLAQQQQDARDMVAEFSGLVKDEQIDQSYRLNDAQKQRETDRLREGDYALAEQQRNEQQGRLPEHAEALSNAQGFGAEEPNAMQMAMQRAQQKALDNEFSGLLKQERANLNEMRANVKKVAGVPVEQISTPQLKEIAQSEAHPNTKMAAVAALNDRHDAIQQERERLMQLREARLAEQSQGETNGVQPHAANGQVAARGPVGGSNHVPGGGLDAAVGNVAGSGRINANPTHVAQGSRESVSVPNADSQANVRALTENAAKRQATQLTNQGFPTVAYPHPTQPGMWVIGSHAEAKSAPAKEQQAQQAQHAPVEPAADDVPVINVRQQTPRKKPASNTLAQAIINLGGISTSLKQDITGDASVRSRPGLFTKNGTADLSELAARLSGEFGFTQIDVNDPTDNSGAKQLADLIASSVNGETILNEEAMIRAQQDEEFEQAKAEVNLQAQEIGIKPIRGKRTIDIVQSEINAILAEREEMSRQKKKAQLLLDEVAEQKLIEAFDLAMQEYHDETAISRDESRVERARLSAEESAQGDGDSVDQASPPAGRTSPTEGVRGEAEVAPEFGLVGQTEEEAIAEEQARRDEDQRKADEDRAEDRRIAAEETARRNVQNVNTVASDNFQLGQSRQEVRRMVHSGMVDMFGAGHENANSGEAKDGNTQDSASTEQGGASNSHGERIHPRSDLPDGTRIVDGNGNPYRVHYQRNSLVVAHPIIDGKPVVSADTSVRFWVDPNREASGENDRLDPIYRDTSTSQEQPAVKQNPAEQPKSDSELQQIGSPQWALDMRNRGEVPEGWYVHGRKGRQDLNTNNVIQMTRDWDVADQYAKKDGSQWLIRPAKDATVLDLSSKSSKDMDRVVERAIRDFENGDLDFIEWIEASIGRDATAGDVENAVRESFAPGDIVNSAEAYDNWEFAGWLVDRFGVDFVETPDGAVAMDGDTGIEKVKVPNEGDQVTSTSEQTKETDAGVAMFNAKSGSIGNPIDASALESTIASVIAASPSQWSRDTVVTATLFADLPAPILAKAKNEGYDAHGRKSNGEKLTGVAYDGKVYLVQENISSELEAEETLLHERIHQILHGNAEDENGKALRQSLGRLYSRIGGKDAIVALAKRAGADMSGPLAALPRVALSNRPAFLVDEFLAHVEGQRAYEKFPQNVVRAIREFYGEFRDWLRSSKFVKIADAVGVNLGNFTQSDLSWTLKKIRQQTAGTGSKAIRFMTAWHGSPHDHDGFDSSKIGTGEGAQAYGWGLYFAGAREVAEWYRKTLSARGDGSRDSDLVVSTLTRMRDEWGVPESQLKEKLVEWFSAPAWNGMRERHPDFDAFISQHLKRGHLYQVELAPTEDELLDWDKPLSEQSEKVKAALRMEVDGQFGEGFFDSYAEAGNDYRDLKDNLFEDLSEKDVSMLMLSLGIRGIKYLDGSSRSAGEGNHNFVIFDHGDVKITAKESRRASNDLDFTQPRGYEPLRKTSFGYANDTHNLFHVSTFKGNDGDVSTFDVHDTNTGRKLGEVALGLRGDEITTLANIEAKDKKSGFGEQLLRSLVANNPDGIYIINMLPEAVPFWQKMGVSLDEHFEGVWEHGNGVLTEEAIQTARNSERGIAAEDSGGERKESRGSEESGRGRQADNPVSSKGVADKTAPANAGVSVSAPSESVRRIQTVVERFKSQFKGAAALDIRVVSTTFDIPARFRPSPFAEGVFHDDAGLVYLVTMNLRNPLGVLSENRAWQVLLHESVGHYGLSQMMGDKFGGILKAVKQATQAGRQVSETQSNPLQPGDKDYTTWEAVKLRYPDASDSEVAQEVLARMSETDPGSSIVGYAVATVRQWVRDVARAMGVNVIVSTSELRDLVAKASGYMRRGDNLAEEHEPSGLVAASTGVAREGGKRGLESRAATVQPQGPIWSAPEMSRTDNIIYTMQDKNIDLKRVQQAIKSAVGEIRDDIDAYLQEELYHGRTATRTKDFVRNELEPLINEMRLRKVEMADFEEYLWMRHAEERNEAMRKRNPTQKELDARLDAAQNERDMLKRDPTVAQFIQLERDLIEAKREYENGTVDDSAIDIIQNKLAKLRKDDAVKEFSALRDEIRLLRTTKPFAGDNTALSGVSTKEAKDYLSGLPADKRKAYESLAKKVDAINKETRQTWVRYGIESQGAVDAMESAYQYYVPLMREDMDHARGAGTGQGFSVKGNSSKRATGSNRAVVDILANMAQAREKAIIRGEKNRVATALIGLAALNPNPDFWKVDTPPTVRTVNERTGMVEERIDPTYKNRDNVIMARIPDGNGNIVEHSVVFSEHDERAMRMAQSLKNLDQDQIGEVLGTASAITRYFASINTQYNPIFGVINLTRDVQGAMLNLSSTPLAGKQSSVLGNTVSALRGIYADIRDHRKGKTPSSAWAQLWEEFQKEGGQTGYRDMFKNAKERAEALEKGLDPDWWQTTKWGKVLTIGGALNMPEKMLADKAVKPLFEWLTDYNETMENAVRLAAYKVAKESGMSNQQAASLAKNLTINFNRKGEIGRQVGALYAFFNASVQGTARMAETLNHGAKPGELLGKAGKQIVYGGLLLGAVQAMLLMAAGFDDEEPPEFVRDRNIIIPTVNGKYISIPMPLGFHVLPAIGRISVEFTAGGFKKPGEHLVHVMDVLLDSFNPIGNAGMSMQTLAPTVIDPVAALTENKDWSGRQIARQDFSKLNPTPGYTRSKDTASSLSRGLAYALNYLSGGGEYGIGIVSPTPDQIEYLIGQVTGGVGRELGKIVTTGEAIGTGEDLPLHKIPLVGRFYGDTTGQSSEASKFYGTLEKLAEHKGALDRMKDAHASEAYQDYLRKHPESRLYGRAASVQREVANLRKLKRQLLDRGADRAKIRQVEDRMKAVMARFNQSASERIRNQH